MPFVLVAPARTVAGFTFHARVRCRCEIPSWPGDRSRLGGRGLPCRIQSKLIRSAMWDLLDEVQEGSRT